MSSSMECAEFANQKPAAGLSEKRSFTRTCSLVSQYLKEKGSLGDLSLGMTCKTETYGNFATSRQPTTMNLFPCEVSSKDEKPKDLFPSKSRFSSSAPKEDSLKMAGPVSVNPEAQVAPMTIFYAGQVVVLNDIPAEKAKEIMNLANKGSAKSFTAFTSNASSVQSAFNPDVAKNQTESRSSVPPSTNPVPNFGTSLTQELIQPSSAAISCVLPIARRASLHRFLEKRKDRVTARAPYQTSGQDTAASKPAENKPWLGLASLPPQ